MIGSSLNLLCFIPFAANVKRLTAATLSIKMIELFFACRDVIQVDRFNKDQGDVRCFTKLIPQSHSIILYIQDSLANIRV